MKIKLLVSLTLYFISFNIFAYSSEEYNTAYNNYKNICDNVSVANGSPNFSGVYAPVGYETFKCSYNVASGSCPAGAEIIEGTYIDTCHVNYFKIDRSTEVITYLLNVDNNDNFVSSPTSTISNTYETDLDAENSCKLFNTSNGNFAYASYNRSTRECTYVGLTQTPCESPFVSNTDNSICSLQMIITGDDDTSTGTDTSITDDTLSTDTSTVDDNNDDGFSNVDEDDYFYPDNSSTSTVDDGNDNSPDDEFDDVEDGDDADNINTDNTNTDNTDTSSNNGSSNLITLPTNFYSSLDNNTNALSNLTNAVNTNNQLLSSNIDVGDDVMPDEYHNLDTSSIDDAITYLGNLVADDTSDEEEFDYSYDIGTLTDLGDYNGGNYGTDGNFAGSGGNYPFSTFTIPTTNITIDTSFLCTSLRPILNFFMSIVVIGLLIWGFRFILTT